VRICSGEVVDAIQLEFTDGTFTPWRGSSQRKATEFALSKEEDIVDVQYIADSHIIQRLRFKTSIGEFIQLTTCDYNVLPDSVGRHSPWYGTKGAEHNSRHWNAYGLALAGFVGITGETVSALLVRPTKRHLVILLKVLSI
jgi:hypothetical protein